MTSIFFPTYWVYALLFFAETFTVYLWYYGWDWLSGSRKWIHVSLGVLAISSAPRSCWSRTPGSPS